MGVRTPPCADRYAVALSTIVREIADSGPVFEHTRHRTICKACIDEPIPITAPISDGIA